jgi:hypothetical protein
MPTWTFTLTGDPVAKLEQARGAAAKQGVKMTGGTNSGQFSGLVTGSYSRSGSQVTVTITRKPAYASWGMIKGRLQRFLEG